ncbi:PAS domain-containing sensor histidine kinase [Pusillimonas sp. T2]|uniref:nitrogen regulation protein NR(II) n=1 Tax=Pusillimonas sp. T2 TaxID=1548123 RepID=UPI000B9D172F|nr:nitrogen regulation protein NR(II) [Pusillimonas sp. T2]OXR49314.1 PAS domain-containing sensor histidine kinase [Pusillimonas sp. T2]
MTHPESYDLLATAVLLLDGKGQVAFANSSAEELFGVSRRQMQGVPAQALFHADDALAHRFTDALAGRFGILRQDAAIRTSTGQSVPVGLVLVPLEHQPWVALLEVRSLDQHDMLDRTLQLTKELNIQRESLRNLAHEVKNPLGGLRGAAQLLEVELDDSALREYTRVIVAEADRLSSLIDRLIAPQGDTLVRKRFNIHEVCERVYTLVSAEYAQKIQFVRDYDASVPDVLGDLPRLVQALLNIARNACQALTETPGAAPPRLVFRTRIGRQLVLATRPVKMGVIVSVIDNGPGVAPDLHDKIFHPLVTGRASGSGLGLSLAQEFVQQHGGVIEFDSHPGHTEFRLILPLE